jgi:hypothetical protein
VLQSVVDAATLSRIAAPLKQFDPYATYRKPPGGRGGSGSNWNCVALAGHFLLGQFGVRSSALDLQYVEDSLLAQGAFFRNPDGLYMEGPSTYDIFPRAWLIDMLSWGYGGEGANALRNALERAAAVSLFMQSPTGEWVCGGRSGQHVWADAMQCVVFEAAARSAVAKGQRRLAGVYRRAARRALQEIRIWQRASGEMAVVKNRIDPALAHGFEVYSSHSQYNLLALTALGMAYEQAIVAGEDLAEAMTPSEGATALFRLASPMSLICASAGGTQVVVHTEPKPGQNPAGFLRLHFLGCPGQLAVPDNLVANPQYRLPQEPGINAALGLCWMNDDEIESDASKRSIADVRVNRLSVAATEHPRRSDGELDFDLTWRMKGEAPGAIVESYSVSDGRVKIEYRWRHPALGMALRIPVLVSDGLNLASVETHGRGLLVTYGICKVTYEVSGAQFPFMVSEKLAGRTGLFSLFEFQATHDVITLTICRL